MNRTVKTAFMLLLGAASVQAQDVAGVITYENNSRLGAGGNGNQVMIRTNINGNESVETLDVITFNQTFTFNGIFGKLASERGGFAGMPAGMPLPSGGPQVIVAQRAGSARPSVNGAGQGLPQLPFTNATYIDLSKQQFLQVLETTGGKKEAWFTAEPFKTATDFKPTEKTKKIAGYSCKKATAKLKDELFTIWYTTEIPLTFSPINGLVPPGGGFVLQAESSNRSFEAKKVEMKPVQPAEVMPPATAEKVESKDLNEKRRALFEKFQNDQLKQQQ